MKNLLREKILKKEKVVGTFLGLGNAGVAECAALAGLDFVIIDTEHGPIDVETAINSIMASELHNMTPLVRVKDGNRNSILKMLDIGAKGLIVPFLDTVEEMREIISYGKYYPLGERGVAFARGAGYGYAEHAQGGMEEYFKICNRETLLIPQCERAGCLEHIEEITALDGIDGIFVGPYDLLVSLGMPGRFDNPEVRDAINRVLNACKINHKFSIIYSGTPADGRLCLKQGFDGVAVGMDHGLLVEKFREMAAEVLG